MPSTAATSRTTRAFTKCVVVCSTAGRTHRHSSSSASACSWRRPEAPPVAGVSERYTCFQAREAEVMEAADDVATLGAAMARRVESGTARAGSPGTRHPRPRGPARPARARRRAAVRPRWGSAGPRPGPRAARRSPGSPSATRASRRARPRSWRRRTTWHGIHVRAGLLDRLELGGVLRSDRVGAQPDRGCVHAPTGDLLDGPWSCCPSRSRR
jgi:hypothetical protein